ncbi:FlgO family outer membrane protein [Crenothrix polyspora]|uniref:Peroxiredoxin n=1 Tax=Crenothrix polyspora TaxID=360316 RepID=A0A1R4H1I8_9GAMM|nr:FlgO family outer membrane protein [Crenothrix polyspora]SJM90098.1 Peroxiredoxin [Crenothrix polyspora]
MITTCLAFNKYHSNPTALTYPHNHKKLIPLLLASSLSLSYLNTCCADEGIAQANEAYGQLLAGKLPNAESTFQKMAKSANPEVAIKGEEGLAETQFRRGKIVEASLRIDRVVKKAPKRAMARAIKAKILYKQGKKKEAEVELSHAEKGKSDFRWQKAAVHTLKGNLYRKRKEPQKALAAFKQALAEEPNDRDALTNMGVTLQDLGQPEQAVKAFSQLKQQYPNDHLGNALLRQAQAAIAQKQDLEKQRYINQLVKELVERYKKQSQEKPIDDWTTPAIAVSILGFANSGDDLAERAGLGTALQNELTTQLQAANIKVVDRAILDKVMSELNLGASNLADPDAALKLGKIIAARLIATGSLQAVSADENTVNLRLVDTETTDIVLPLSEKQTGSPDPISLANKFSQSIASTIKDKYPMKGRIALAEGDNIVINLGKKHNISQGMKFNVLGENEQPIELNGKILGYRQTKVGQLEISKVEDLMSYAKPIGSTGSLEKNQKIIQAQ